MPNKPCLFSDFCRMCLLCIYRIYHLRLEGTFEVWQCKIIVKIRLTASSAHVRRKAKTIYLHWIRLGEDHYNQNQIWNYHEITIPKFACLTKYVVIEKWLLFKDLQTFKWLRTWQETDTLGNAKMVLKHDGSTYSDRCKDPKDQDNRLFNIYLKLRTR